jgi:hypothetical protein
MKPSRWSIAALLLSSLAGCASQAAPRAKATTPVAAPRPVAAASAESDRTSDLETVSFYFQGGTQQARVARAVLLDPGKGERAPMRWPGQRMSTQLELRVATRTLGDDGAGATIDESASVALTLGMMSLQAEQDENVYVGAKILAARVIAGAKSSAPIEAYANLKDSMMVWVVSPRGQQLAGATTAPEGQHEVLRALADQVASALFAPLPSEPIGIGARWRTRQVVPLAGTLLGLEETTYTLEARQEGIATVEARVVRVPLDDAQGLLTSEASQARQEAALRAVARRSTDQLARSSNFVPRGSQLRMFVEANPLFGIARRVVSAEGNGRIESGEDVREMRVTFVEQVEIFREGIEIPGGEDAPETAAPATTTAAATAATRH